MSKLKIVIHIPFYIKKNLNKKKIKLNIVCKEYLKLNHKIEIFVHTNIKIKSNNKKITFVYHNLKHIHPYKLTWICRNLMFSQRTKYDIFIYGEDDILFSNKNLKYWLNYKKKCLNNNYNLGFLRVETKDKDKNLYLTDQISKLKYYVKLNNEKFIKLNNPNSSFWIFDKDEFNNFVKSKYWNFKWNWISFSGKKFTREMAAIGWGGENMNGIFMDRYQATIVPINGNALNPGSFIKHISNNYAKNPAGLFGTFKTDNIIDKKIYLFKPITKLKKIILRIKFLAYYYIRINIKNIFK